MKDISIDQFNIENPQPENNESLRIQIPKAIQKEFKPKTVTQMSKHLKEKFGKRSINHIQNICEWSKEPVNDAIPMRSLIVDSPKIISIPKPTPVPKQIQFRDLVLPQFEINHISEVKEEDRKDSFEEMIADIRKTVHSLHVDNIEKIFTNLENIENLLCKVFKNEKISIMDFRLSKPEMHILVELLLRKTKGRTKIK